MHSVFQWSGGGLPTGGQDLEKAAPYEAQSLQTWRLMDTDGTVSR